ncbi:sperm flagellar protein 2 isoform X2 [Dunckerocampus dactyliophorus]|uniref:sperm flagellar protein 2 isoform X2 n=1 Tax=Dunckerocampus dactyliophorus TaxID=161453 RepID=UPI0024061109|nr:sperm flagellar protein 2 isoform X2 [Dunckerocampus dactyliophorus]
MSDILCKWLNEELRLSKVVDPNTFAKDFSSGYLIGEVLQKYGMLNDVSVFTKTDTSMSKLNNFTHLEPTLHLLGISFDLTTAQGLMQEKVGVATHLLYQLYVSLEKKRKSEMSKATMEIMQPVAITTLQKKDHQVFSDRFSHVSGKHDAEVLQLQKMTQHYTDKKRYQMDDKSAHAKSQHRVQDEKRGIHMRKFNRPKYSDIITIQNQATDVQVPKPPPYSSLVNLRRQKRHQRKEQQAQIVETEIAQFETNRKKLATSGFASSSGGLDASLASSTQGCGKGGNELMLQSSSKYIQDIRQRLQENEAASEQREKRRNRCLIEQLKAHEAQEERRREEQLVRYLTGQTLQEKRLAVQLLQMRKQKDAFRQNRLLKEQQFQQQREKEFREALEREAALTRQAQLDCAEEIRLELEFCKKMAEECAQNRSKKHFEKCKEILEQIVDLATKVGEYRLLTANLIPAKLMLEWKELLLNGLPLYEQPRPTSPDPVELQKQEILNNQDYDEYTNMVGEWTWPEEAGETCSLPGPNMILRHVLFILRSMALPPRPSSCPGNRIKACVLGKFCSGKTTCLKKIAEELNICVLSVDTLVKQALTAHKNGEVTENKEDIENKVFSRVFKYGQEEILDTHLSARALLGRVAATELSKGSVIPDELLVDILVEAIRLTPPESGWILDGFPVNVDQAYLLETALASLDTENEFMGRKIDLLLDPNPPTPPPPPPVLDLAVVLNIPDHSVAKRAIHHADRHADTTADKKLYVAQIPHRIATFQDNWPKLQEWFESDGRKSILMKVNADVQKEELYRNMKKLLQKTIMQKLEAPAVPSVDEVALEKTVPVETSRPMTPVQIEQTPTVTNEAVKIEESESKQTEDRDPEGKEVSADALPDEELQEAPPISSSPGPGSPGWVYVDEPVSLDKSEYLCQQWEAVCDSYVSSVKSVMEELRMERTIIDHHLYDVREEFRQYLERPDLKQELVSQWQKDYNSIPDDLRQNEETKAELNHRLDDLREHLWDIVDTHKEDDESQRAVLIGEKWLEDHTIVLVNHHLRLIQVEMSRFQNTRNILRDYYLNAGQQDHVDCITFLENSDMGPARELPEILISKQDEAFAVISKMVSTEPLQVDLRARELESIQEKERAQEKDKEKDKEKEKEKDKSNKKNKGSPSPPPAPSPTPAVETPNVEKTPGAVRQVKNKLIKEYTAALKHEENAAKARIKLAKGHGLTLVNSLQSRAEQLFNDMQDWLEAHYVAQMKSIDQLTEVVRHYIETALQLENELVLESIDFYFNGDSQLVPSPPTQPSPLASEKATPSMLTIVQLKSLYNSFCNEAPSGFISNSEFFRLISDMVPFNTLPEPWVNMTETQLNEIISLLMNESKQIDWRQFLLSAALPWPYPTLTALLGARQLFKAADADGTGYISEEEYLQTELWFPGEDASELSHHDRLGKLHKFFFQLFADHSDTPPRLDYMSMLLYFTSDPDPKQGFIRALSVMTGLHLKYPPSGPLVTSETSPEEAMALSSSESEKEHKEDMEEEKEEEEEEEEDHLEEQQMSIPTLLSVLCPEMSRMKSGLPLPPSQEVNNEHLVQIFADLGYTPEDCVPFSVLLKHSTFQNLIESTDNHVFVVQCWST